MPKFDGICSTDIWVIESKEGFDNGFMFYFLADERIIKKLTESSEGTRMPRARWDYLVKLSYPMPPPQEQRHIASILSSLDDKIELNRQMNSTLEQIAQALFKHWFVDFEFPNDEGKPYKSSGGKMVFSEELQKEVPEGWEVGRLGDYITTTSGCAYTSKGLEQSEEALVTLKSIGIDGFKQEGFKEYTGEYKEKQVVEDGDIVVAHTDLTQHRIILGKPAIVRDLGKYKKMIASMDLSIVRPVKLLNRSFIYYLLSTDEFHNHAQGYSNGTTVIHLSRKAIPEYRFVVPDQDILHKFESVIDVILNRSGVNEKDSLSLSKMRDSLLPKFMSGEIRVR